MEKALHQAVQGGARVIVAGTTAEYLRHSALPARAAALAEPSGALPPLTVTQAEPPRPAAPPPPPSPTPAPPAVPPPAAGEAALGTRYVKTPTANLRESGGTAGRIIRSVPRGTRLEVLETKAGWHRVRLPDGGQGWLADSVTSTTRP